MIEIKNSKKILEDALKKEEPITVVEIINYTSMKFLGSKTTDLYIFTKKTFINKILLSNIQNIKKSVETIEDRSVKNIYLNNKLINSLELKELKSKKNINTININSIKDKSLHEVSGENDIIESIFSYETTVGSKKKITLKFYNKFLVKEYSKEINTSITKGSRTFFARRKLVKKIKELLELKYEPSDNNTKEIVKLLHID